MIEVPACVCCNPKLSVRFSDDLIYEASDWSMDVPLPPTNATAVSPDIALQLHRHLHPPGIRHGTAN